MKKRVQARKSRVHGMRGLSANFSMAADITAIRSIISTEPIACAVGFLFKKGCEDNGQAAG